jgi:hypothetical protein
MSEQNTYDIDISSIEAFQKTVNDAQINCGLPVTPMTESNYNGAKLLRQIFGTSEVTVFKGKLIYVTSTL